MDRFASGDVAYVALESWAGRTWHKVLVLSVKGLRATVEWLDEPALGRRRHSTYHAPLSALRLEKPRA